VHRPHPQRLVGEILAQVTESCQLRQPMHGIAKIPEDTAGRRRIVWGDVGVDLAQVGCRQGQRTNDATLNASGGRR
jgi:hypothetical protein